MEECAKWVMILQPVEIIADPDFGYRDALYDIKKQIRKTTVSLYDIPMDVDGSLQHILQVSKLDGYGLALAPGRRQTCCLLLNYICQTQSSNIHSNSISFHHRNQRVLLDNITIKNLELFTSSYDHNPSHSLFGVINTTNTAMGARTLSQWIINPTQDKKTLEMRLNHIQSYSEDLTQVSSLESSGLIQELKKLNDIPKLLSTIIYRKPRPTLLAKIRNNLEIILGKSPNTPSVILNNLQKV
jgi:DNA mismatch repair protein MutS